ncbi:unnamed protein product [Rotaria sp. Silwood2]|nr:unnamed protein product [Rotaria sp. Silwood2]
MQGWSRSGRTGPNLEEVKRLRKIIADFLRQRKDIDMEEMLKSRHETREDYCNSIETTKRWGGEPEIIAFSMLYEIMVWVTSVNSKDKQIYFVKYPSEKNSFNRCCYIIRNNDHYKSLHLRNSSNKAITIFDCKDENEANERLIQFVKKEFVGA